jgi:hypothetical protein
MTTRLVVQRIPHLNTLVLRQKEGRDFFIAANDSIVISVDTFAYIISFLVENSYLSPKVLEGILEEFNSTKGDSIDRLPHD